MLLHLLQRHLAPTLPCRMLWCPFTHFQAEESSPIDKPETDRLSFLHQGPILTAQGGTGLSESQRKGNREENTRGDNLGLL